MNFTWLHGTAGHLCDRCSYCMDSLQQEQKWDGETRTYTYTDREVCQPCRASEPADSKGPTSPSRPCLSTMAQYLRECAIVAGRR